MPMVAEIATAKPEPDPVRAALGDPVMISGLRTSTISLLRSWMQQLSQPGREQEADDIIDEARCRALTAQYDPAGGKSVGCFLFGIIRMVIRERLRKLSIAGSAVADSNAISDCRDPQPSIPELLANAEQHDILMANLAKLSRARQELIRKRYFEGISCADIARMSNQNPNTVRQRLSRALQELQLLVAPLFREERR